MKEPKQKPNLFKVTQHFFKSKKKTPTIPDQTISVKSLFEALV